MSHKTIKVDYLARVEGEGALYIKYQGNQVEDVKLRIFEPPRFFEAFLRDRKFTEAPDLTSRICGICPIAYQMSACHAMEDACGASVSGVLRELRRMIYCGEWIESHALHAFMLHAPDFLGYQDAVSMARDYPDVVKAGLEIKKIGNQLVTMLGGREIHPVNIRVGGFYRAPRLAEMRALEEPLERATQLTLESLRWAAGLNYPDFERDYEFVCLRHPDEYPFNEGRLISNRGMDIPIADFFNTFQELHVEHSNALHCVRKDNNQSYHVGPLARYTLNFDRLPDMVQAAALEAGLGKECRNPFKSLLVRLVEVLYALQEALRILRAYTEVPTESFVPVTPRAGVGHGCTEAPRGILYHRYQIDADGLIQDAKIVPPTSQNQKQIEDDLWHYVSGAADLSEERLTWECEQAVRNYDPCISCATHFLKLTVDRS
ncbi:MAG: Ni/Fe hydrogenase subunit alpha [Leptospiraceae bacterium]|nr:Ni/Fe hydrogenase subunit alpha [Leptospiraceae bacterium]